MELPEQRKIVSVRMRSNLPRSSSLARRHEGALLKPNAGDCCVFCSYGDVPCRPKQEAQETRIADCCPGVSHIIAVVQTATWVPALVLMSDVIVLGNRSWVCRRLNILRLLVH